MTTDNLPCSECGHSLLSDVHSNSQNTSTTVLILCKECPEGICCQMNLNDAPVLTDHRIIPNDELCKKITAAFHGHITKLKSEYGNKLEGREFTFNVAEFRRDKPLVPDYRIMGQIGEVILNEFAVREDLNGNENCDFEVTAITVRITPSLENN